MKINKIVLVLAMLVFVAFSCADDDLAPIVTFDSAGKGAYPRLITETDKLINLLDVAGSAYSFNVEMIDIEGGTLVAEYVIDLIYDDNDASNGDNSIGPIEFRTYTQSDFTPNANGYQESPMITITGAEAFAAAGVTEADVIAGDNFRFIGRVVLTDGTIFSRANSSSTIVGSAFRGHFNFTMPAACPSNLVQTVSYVTTDLWCGNADVTGTVDIISQGGGVYNFSDWSFGGYDCYGAVANQPGITFTEVCTVVNFSAVTDSYGDVWTFDSSISGDTWVINWVNTYGEAANSTLTFDSAIPFTLKD